MSDQEYRQRLHEALHAGAEEHGLHPGAMLTGWVTVAAAVAFDDDGEQVTQVLVMPHDVAEHEALGLLDHATTRMRADILSGYMED